jgi:hypothetical protein
MDIVDLVFGFFEKLPIPGWLWVVGFFGILLAMLVFHLSLGVRRDSMWKRAALIISFEHRDEDTSLARNFEFLDSLSDVDGFDTRSLDVLTGEWAGRKTWLLDHSSGSKQRKFRTVCIMRSKQIRVPHFHLYQRGGHWFLQPSRPEIVFQEDRDFSRIFVLSAENSEVVRNLFVPAVREHFKRLFNRCREIERMNNNWLTILMLRVSGAIGRFEVEASGDTLIIHLSRIINPQGAVDFLSVTAETLQILQNEQKSAEFVNTDQ